MAICIVVIPPRADAGRYGSPNTNTLEVIYRSGDKAMRLDQLDRRPGRPNSARRDIDMHGLHWTAQRWRLQDGLSDWEYFQ
jgi:hypothetical protein